MRTGELIHVEQRIASGLANPIHPKVLLQRVLRPSPCIIILIIPAHHIRLTWRDMTSPLHPHMKSLKPNLSFLHPLHTTKATFGRMATLLLLHCRQIGSHRQRTPLRKIWAVLGKPRLLSAHGKLSLTPTRHAPPKCKAGVRRAGVAIASRGRERWAEGCGMLRIVCSTPMKGTSLIKSVQLFPLTRTASLRAGWDGRLAQ